MLHVSLSSVFSLIVQFYQLGFLTHLAFWLFFKVYWFDKTELQVKRLTNQKNMICYDELVLNLDCFFNTRHQFQHSTPCPNDMIDTSKAFLNMTKSTNFFNSFLGQNDITSAQTTGNIQPEMVTVHVNVRSSAEGADLINKVRRSSGSNTTIVLNIVWYLRF